MLLRHRPVLVLLFGSIVFVFGGIGWFFSPRLHTFHPANPDTAPLLQERAGWRTLVTRTTREPHFGQLPPLADGGATKWALLVGVTRYDHLAAQVHLRGSGNDVDLMRATLVGRYGFPPVNVVSLTESEGKPDLRPTRANIAREFRRLAQKAKAGDQVVILLAGHGARQPESDPPDPVAPEPDGIDEIFLPADVKPWAGYPGRVPNAIADKELRDWLAAITAKKAYVPGPFSTAATPGP